MGASRRVGLIAVLTVLAGACTSDAGRTSAATSETPGTTGTPTSTVASTTAAPTTSVTTTASVPRFEDVTIAVSENMVHLPVFVAHDLGLWADRGLNVRLELSEEPGVSPGGGEGDLIAVDLGMDVAMERAGGGTMKLVVPYNNDALSGSYIGWMGIVGRADAGVTEDPRSALGKRMAVAPAGTAREYAERWLRHAGLSGDDVRLVEMPVAEMEESIVAGDVDVVVPWDPVFISTVIELGANAVIVSDGEPLLMAAIGAAATEESVAERPEVFERVLEGLVEAMFEIRNNPEELTGVVANISTAGSPDAALAAMARNSYDPRVSICTEWGAEKAAQQLFDDGALQSDELFLSTDLIDTSLLTTVLEEHPEWTEDLRPVPVELVSCEGFVR